jgi:hypothetical protein
MGLFSCPTTSNELICAENEKAVLIQCEHGRVYEKSAREAIHEFYSI